MTTEEHEEKLKENDRDYVYDMKDYELYIDEQPRDQQWKWAQWDTNDVPSKGYQKFF